MHTLFTGSKNLVLRARTKVLDISTSFTAALLQERVVYAARVRVSAALFRLLVVGLPTTATMIAIEARERESLWVLAAAVVLFGRLLATVAFAR